MHDRDHRHGPEWGGVKKGFPEYNPNKPREEQELVNKFKVTRRDGKDEPGRKHCDCEYFVLDLDHDPFAVPALRAYAEACADTYPDLAEDLLDKANALEAKLKK